MIDGKAFGTGLATTIKAFIARRVGEIDGRINAVSRSAADTALRVAATETVIAMLENRVAALEQGADAAP